MNRTQRRAQKSLGKGAIAAGTKNLRKATATILPGLRLPDVSVRGSKLDPGELPAPQLPSVLDERTPEQRAIGDAGEWAKKLVTTEPSLLQLSTAMIAFRRAYAVAYREMQEAIDAIRAKPEGQEMPEIMCDFFAQFSMTAAAAPFNEHDLMQGIIREVLPWMATVIDRHSAHDAQKEREAVDEVEEARKAKPIPLGFQHTPLAEVTGSVMDRRQSLVIVGWRPAVLWMLDQICDHVIKLKGPEFVSVLRLTVGSDEQSDPNDHYVKLPLSAWRASANSDATLDHMVGDFVNAVVTGKLDLLICDDLAAAYTSGYVGRPAGARAGDAHRRYRRWCTNRLGAGLIGGVLLDTPELNVVPTPAFEQLKTFTCLRGLSVVEKDAETWRLTFGDHATVFDVAKTALDAYAEKAKLIVPGDITTP